MRRRGLLLAFDARLPGHLARGGRLERRGRGDAPAASRGGARLRDRGGRLERGEQAMALRTISELAGRHGRQRLGVGPSSGLFCMAATMERVAQSFRTPSSWALLAASAKPSCALVSSGSACSASCAL